jgi:hypothetical protein
MTSEMIDPEFVLGEKEYFKPSAKCDFYSLSIILWQIFHKGQDPYPFHLNSQTIMNIARKIQRPIFDDKFLKFRFERKRGIELQKKDQTWHKLFIFSQKQLMLNLLSIQMANSKIEGSKNIYEK